MFANLGTSTFDIARPIIPITSLPWVTLLIIPSLTFMLVYIIFTSLQNTLRDYQSHLSNGGNPSKAHKSYRP